MNNVLTEQQLNLIVGSLLGDGSIRKGDSDKNARFVKVQCLRHREYLDWHYQVMLPFSKSVDKVHSKKIITGKDGKIEICDILVEQALFRTRNDCVFNEFRDKWYVGSKKVIPRDLVLNAEILAIWLCDDGCNLVKNRSVSFATQGFSKDEVVYLSECIDKLGIKNYVNRFHRKEQFIIGINTKSYLDFIDLVKPYVRWNCMSRKIDLSLYVAPKPSSGERHGMSILTEDKVKLIFYLFSLGNKQTEIAKIVGTHHTNVSCVLRGKTWKHLYQQNRSKNGV